MPRRLIWLAVCIGLTGCASVSKTSNTESLNVMALAQPIGPTRRVEQQLIASWPGKQDTMLCVLELDKQHIAIAGLSTEGISLFNVSYDGQKLVLEKSPLLPDSFSPDMMIKDLQLVYWPVAMLTELLPEHWRLEADNRHRRLYVNNEVRVDIVFPQADANWPQTVNLTNYRYHYQLHIKTLSYESVPE